MTKKILMILSALFGLMMVNSGFNKFFNYMPLPEMPENALDLIMAFGASGWLLSLIAVVEIVGGVLFAIPKYRALGAIIILPVTVGILLFHVVQDPATVMVSIILMGINIWAILMDKEKFMPLLQPQKVNSTQLGE